MRRTVPTATHAQVPQGAPFRLETSPFRPGTPQAIEVATIGEDKIVDWPVVYILTGDRDAYVGQTTNAYRRMLQHAKSKRKRRFDQATFIFNDELNTSAAVDYEHRLIGCLHADGRYRVTNRNNGLEDTNYFSKAEYGEMFEALWQDLRDRGIAENPLSRIEDSDVFKYSPYKSLTLDQYDALRRIMEAIKADDSEKRPIVIEGTPGTGKTVLAVHLMKMLKDDPRYHDLNVKLLEPVTSVRTTLRDSLGTVAGLRKKDVISPFDLKNPRYGFVSADVKSIDVLLVDEAHKLKQRKNLGRQRKNYRNACDALGLDADATQLDWALSQAKLAVLFYDPLQAIGPNCITPEQMSDRLGPATRNPITLTTQMRVKGGREYVRYVMDVLNGRDPEPRDFGDYELVLHDDFDDFYDSFQDTWERHDLTRMAAGFGWPWVTRPDENPRPGLHFEGHDFELGHIDLRWNSTNDAWVALGLEDPFYAHEVGCIHSTQGYDLSYAYVIIAPDARLDARTGAVACDRVHYYDSTGRDGATQEELDAFIRNIYYVLLTRGIYGTHIYVVDPELRAHLRRYF